MTIARASDAAGAPGASSGALAPFLFTLRTKGAAGLVARVATVGTRFGPTPHIMMRRLDRMIDAAASAGFRPTCPITATVLARHPNSVRALADRGMEIAVHGLRHNDHLAQDEAVQTSEIARAVAVFSRFGIEPAGFRAPYLRADERTRAAARRAGLGYQSDDAVVFDTQRIPATAVATDAYQRAVVMYAAQDAATRATRPSLEDGLVRIPVCLPDDEMLVDRLHLPDHECAQSWGAILDSTHERGDLFTMQVHPERFVRSAAAVAAVLSRAASLGTVWSARLDEIAQWWRARDSCRIEAGPVVDGTVTYTLVGDRRARMRLVAGHGVTQALREPTRRLTVPADRVPAIALAPEVPAPAIRFLQEDGFLVATQPHGPCALELTGPVEVDDQMALRRRVLDAEQPLLAIDRWPDETTSALALTGDIDALTMQDFVFRMHENAHGAPAWIAGAES